MSIRQNIIDIAMAERELPKPRVADYWQDVLTPQDFEGPHPPAWCGCFCLYCYHRAGLLLDAHWRVGHGFAERFLRHELVTNVQVGDLAYLQVTNTMLWFVTLWGATSSLSMAMA